MVHIFAKNTDKYRNKYVHFLQTNQLSGFHYIYSFIRYLYWCCLYNECNKYRSLRELYCQVQSIYEISLFLSFNHQPSSLSRLLENIFIESIIRDMGMACCLYLAECKTIYDIDLNV